ncbi:MAG TPA: polysaccharide biosynthesis tyrosine autokinase [Gemmatimonadales bacterium]|jgi:tyrosine-protein kinase Etk/Wzc|nr:polysaccharide biosynthesis tyrosine autokinase [Gemmatimonadales bacterium]
MRPLESPDSAGIVSFRQALAVVRRRFQLILAVTAVGAALGLFLASQEPTSYRASAMLRLAGERQTLTGVAEEANPTLGRTADPMLSIIELVRSRTVAGVVVDSLGLQLVSQTPEFSVEDLSEVQVDPRAAGDSVQMVFRDDGLSARRGQRAVTAAYGQPVNLGVVQFVVRARPAIENVTLAIKSREAAIDALLVGLVVSRRELTDVIDVAFVAEDPRRAQRIVNSTVHAFQGLNVQWARERSRRRGEFLAEQLASTDTTLERAQAALASFRSRQQLASSRDKLESQQAALLTLDAQREQLNADRQTFGALAERLKATDDASREEALRALATSPAMADNPAIGGLYQQLLKYQNRIDSMTTGPWKASETNPDLVQLRALTRNTQDQLVQSVTSHIGAIGARVNALGDLRSRTGAAIAILPAMAEEEMRLSRRVEAFAAQSDGLRAELQKARMAEAVEAGDIDVVALAPLPSTPLLNSATLKVGLGLFLGLALGMIIAYILEALNTSVRRPEDLEAVLHVPGLAVIPRITDGSRSAQSHFRRLLGSGKAAHATVGSPLTGNQTFSIGIEAFRNLRTGLIWSDGGEQLRTLVVTSAAPGEGKTMTAANLAVTLAYDGLRVLLVDCDIRRPRVHGLFQLPRAPGLMELLRASGDPEAPAPRAIRETPVARLSVLTCGALPVNAANLLSGTRMRVLLAELQEQFDIIVLDTPPVLATADASIVASLTDGVLLVVRAGATDRNAAQRAYQQLANVGARVVGTVLNDPGGEVAKEGDYYYPYDYAAQE